MFAEEGENLRFVGAFVSLRPSECILSCGCKLFLPRNGANQAPSLQNRMPE